MIDEVSFSDNGDKGDLFSMTQSFVPISAASDLQVPQCKHFEFYGNKALLFDVFVFSCVFILLSRECD